MDIIFRNAQGKEKINKSVYRNSIQRLKKVENIWYKTFISREGVFMQG